MSDFKDYDFIVGFTRKGFKTMYRHFDKLIKFTINDEEFLKLKKELYKWKFII